MSRSSVFSRLGIVVAAAWLVVPQSASATTYFYCVVQDYHGRETRYVSDIRQTDVEKIDTMRTGFAYSDEIKDEWHRDYPGQGSRKSYCSKSSNLATLEEERANLLGDNPAARQIAFTKPPVASKPADRSGLIISGSSPSKPSGTKSGSVPKAPSAIADEAEQSRNKTREKREAEWQAELDKYAADKAAWEAKVAAQKAEAERQKAAHAAAREAAARAKAAHEEKMEAHRRRLADAKRARDEWLAVKRRHDRCIAGDQRACEDMAAGKPVDEQLASNEAPKTSDDDARTCVSRPVVSASDTFEGQTQAVVVNGCETAVDVRVCLLRTGGWNCGVTWGLKPQDRWTHTSFETQGEIFWDARVSGSDQPLSSPGGN